MRVLLDTCAISEAARPQGSERVKRRIAAFRDEDLFLSVITLGELANGVALLDAGRKKDRYEAFLLSLEQDFATRILSVDAETGRTWGEITARARRRGKTVPSTDGLIAATALRHGLHVMTRNVADFDETGALIINPWEDA